MIKRPKIGTMGLGGQSVFFRVDHFHDLGETLHAASLFTEPGGKGYNQAVAAHRLGADCLFLGAMGTDSDSINCVDFLQKEGIQTNIQYIPNEHTAYAVILTNSIGDNQVTVYRGAADKLSPLFVRQQEDSLAQCNLLLLNLECPLQAIEEMLSIAAENSIPTIMNPAPMSKDALPLLHKCDLLTPNFQEACIIAGVKYSTAPMDLAKALAQQGFERMVITLGGDGSMIIENRQVWLFPPLSVSAIDTTGAGDCFNGALAVALAHKATLQTAVEFATNASGYSVTIPHVMDSLPNLSQIERSLLPIKGHLLGTL